MAPQNGKASHNKITLVLMEQLLRFMPGTLVLTEGLLGAHEI